MKLNTKERKRKFDLYVEVCNHVGSGGSIDSAVKIFPFGRRQIERILADPGVRKAVDCLAELRTKKYGDRIREQLKFVRDNVTEDEFAELRAVPLHVAVKVAVPLHVAQFNIIQKRKRSRLSTTKK